MSLTLPESFKRPDIIENWIVLLGYGKGINYSGVNTSEVIDTTETGVDVVDGSKFASGDFIFIGTERMKVDSVSSNTLTVTRGINKTPTSQINSGEEIFHDNFKCVSFADAKFEGDYSNGIITSEPSIRESINIENSTAKTGNVSVTVSNFNYQGNPFSKELFAGTRTYINRECFIYIVPTLQTLKVNSLLVYSGRLQDISHDNDSIKLSIVSRTPLDGVEVPQAKTSKDNYYPIAYGDYRPNASQSNANSTGLTFNSSAGVDEYRKRKTLYPIPIEERRGTTIFSLTGDWSQSEKAWPHYYEKSTDTFLPIANHESSATTMDSANETYLDGKAIRFHQNLLKSSFYKMAELTEIENNSPFTWANNNNAFDGDYINTNTFTQCAINGGFINNRRGYVKYSFPQLTGYPSKLQVNMVISGSVTLSSLSGTGEIRIQLLNKSFGADDILGYFSLTNAQTSTTELVTGSGAVDISSAYFLGDAFDSDTEWLASGGGWGEGLQFNLKCILQSGDLDGDLEGTFKIFDVAVQADNQLDFTETTKTGKLVASKVIDDIEYVYSGGDGYPDNGWAGSSAITEIHEAHRDLLQRFTNFTDKNGSIYSSSLHPKNWSSGTNINSIKDWDIRYWINRPTSLKKVLEELQYNGGFIGRYNGQGNYEYIFIPDSITANHTLTKADISKIDISLTPFDNVVTSMNIEYEKHPTTSGYVSEVSSTNSTSISAYNVGSKENKKQIKLNALVSAPASSPSSNPNDDFYTYYDNIIGGVKHLVSFDIVNPVYFGTDVGDFIAFNNIGVDPFGGSWSGKNFIVVSVNRKRGSLKIKVREI